MQRRKFIKLGCVACMAGIAMSELLQSCAITNHIEAKIEGDEMIIPLAEFYVNKNDNTKFKKYIITQNEKLCYPICIFRKNEKEYSALWMKCSHQGAELQVFGDKLQCPAHGSEFTEDGLALSAPANKNLRTFPIIIEPNQLKLSLK